MLEPLIWIVPVDLVDPDVTHAVDPATETAGSNLITDDRKDSTESGTTSPEILVRQRPPELLAAARAAGSSWPT
ncbi:hypothetical protein XI07_04325 [Bradyrhizobium sp. CCBAU 11445]|nr:hypothetical protein [Bradyrhizobium sp. CCBAU 11445]